MIVNKKKVILIETNKLSCFVLRRSYDKLDAENQELKQNITRAYRVLDTKIPSGKNHMDYKLLNREPVELID